LSPRRPARAGRLIAAGTCLALLSAAGPVTAHGTRSVSVEIVELSPGHATLHVFARLPEDRVSVSAAAPCSMRQLASAPGSLAADTSRSLDCPGSVAGASLAIDGLGPIVTEAIVLYSFADGRSGSAVVRADTPRLQLPAAESARAVARSYLKSGLVHILTGYDHLLFLLLLVLALRNVRAVLLAETAFTLSHSLSFSATALGLVHASQPAAEACIAVSLVLMALDIRPDAPRPAWRGASLAFVFGLVHGLGFAGALTEVGLPDGDAAIALLGFAGGVELGQVLFLCAALLVVHGLSRAKGLFSLQRLEPAAVALIGGVSTYWLIDRLRSIFLLS
jgi:hydrogenase/urease accessory protein HupE